MLATCKSKLGIDIPQINRYLGETNQTCYAPLTTGNSYTVHGLLFTYNRVDFLINPYKQGPFWVPSFLFNLTEKEIPPEWKNTHHTLKQWLQTSFWFIDNWQHHRIPITRRRLQTLRRTCRRRRQRSKTFHPRKFIELINSHLCVITTSTTLKMKHLDNRVDQSVPLSTSEAGITRSPSWAELAATHSASRLLEPPSSVRHTSQSYI